MTNEQIQTKLDSLIDLMPEVSDAIMTIYGEFEAGDQHFKEDNSPLTKADMISNQMICNFLRKDNPDIPIISEENKAEPYSVRKKYDWAWMIDPLDGTKEFVNKNGEFTVNIALLKDGKPMAGLVYVPVLKEYYTAIKGEGAHKILDGKKTRLKCSTFRMKDSELRIVSTRSHRNAETEKYLDQFDNPYLILVGSSLKIVRVAEGLADLYPRLGPTMEWDIAAAEIILTEAGGTLLDMKNKPLQYNKEDMHNPHFIAKGICLDE